MRQERVKIRLHHRVLRRRRGCDLQTGALERDQRPLHVPGGGHDIDRGNALGTQDVRAEQRVLPGVRGLGLDPSHGNAKVVLQGVLHDEADRRGIALGCSAGYQDGQTGAALQDGGGAQAIQRDQSGPRAERVLQVAENLSTQNDDGLRRVFGGRCRWQTGFQRHEQRVGDSRQAEQQQADGRAPGEPAAEAVPAATQQQTDNDQCDEAARGHRQRQKNGLHGGLRCRLLHPRQHLAKAVAQLHPVPQAENPVGQIRNAQRMPDLTRAGGRVYDPAAFQPAPRSAPPAPAPRSGCRCRR